MALTWRVSWNAGTTSNIWMETPDIIGFYVDDAPILYGNTVAPSPPLTADNNTSVQIVNPRSGLTEWASVIGPTKLARFSDQPPATTVDKVALHTLANYTVTGRTVTGVYYSDFPIDSVPIFSPSNFISQFRHTVFLKLNAVLTQGSTYTITNTTAGITPITFLFDDKSIRAGGIKLSQIGVRPDESFKRCYLSSRIPGGANRGVVDFAAAPYSITTAKILDATTMAEVATAPVTLRIAWNTMETSDTYSVTGFDVADTATSFAVTGITNAVSPVVTCPGHTFVNGDKVRFRGIAGMTQIELVGASGNASVNLHIAATVSNVVAGTSFQIDINTSGFGTFSATPLYSTALGGISNRVYKCFNTNRAGTNVYDIDVSGITAAGVYYVQIPGYGVSDRFVVDNSAYKTIAGYLHQGAYALRVGCDVVTPQYNRPAALIDGQNGTAPYWSRLVSLFCNENQAAWTPSGTVQALAGLGAYSDEGTWQLATPTIWAGGTVSATTAAPHGVPVGNVVYVHVIGCTPAGYNGGPLFATSTGASTFTYPVASNPGAMSVYGQARTGYVTSTRAVGARLPMQDAADNDDPASDHLWGWMWVAFTLNNIPAPARFTPFNVQKSTSLLNPTLYAGTDALPPLFHELCWYADNYRVLQKADGDIPGGFGLGHFSSQISNPPEAIHQYIGTDAGGSRAGQIVGAFLYASDQNTTMQYAACAAQIALLCQGYSLTTLRDAWKNSAIAAYNRACDIMSDLTKRDAYYITQLDIKNKMVWTTAQYHDGMQVLNTNAQRYKYGAAAALYRLLGPAAGQSPYGNMLEGYIMNSPSIGAGSGGTGYAVWDLITIAGGTLIPGSTNRAIARVSSVSGTVVTGLVVYNAGEYSVAPVGPLTQLSTTGGGSGISIATAGFVLASVVVTDSSKYSPAPFDYAVTPGNNATTKTAMLGGIGGRATANSPVYVSTGHTYNAMYTATTSGANSVPFSPQESIVKHMADVYQSTIAAQRNSVHLQGMAAHVQFLGGANYMGQSLMYGFGVRPIKAYIHEDTTDMGVRSPYGIVPFCWNSFAIGGAGRAFNGTGANTDASSVYVGDNITGGWETLGPSLVQKGSAKMWNNWRVGTSYWEHFLQCRGSIPTAEYVQAQQMQMATIALYIHGWDGNTG